MLNPTERALEMAAAKAFAADEEKKSGKEATTAVKEVYKVLFPIDKDDTEVEVRGVVPAKSLTFLRDIWNDERQIEKAGDFKWEKVLEENDLMSAFQKELLARRQTMK